VLSGFGRRNYYSTQYITAVVSINIQLLTLLRMLESFASRQLSSAVTTDWLVTYYSGLHSSPVLVLSA